MEHFDFVTHYPHRDSAGFHRLWRSQWSERLPQRFQLYIREPVTMAADGRELRGNMHSKVIMGGCPIRRGSLRTPGGR